jgi:ribosomal protein S18 acetylase RimI-like enzyme
MKEQLGFDFLRMDYKFSSTSGYNEEYRYINEYHVEIYGVSYEEDSINDKSVFIGKAKVELYLLDMADNNQFDRDIIFDSSQARRDFFNGIYNFEKNRFCKKVEERFDESFNSNLLNIERIEILPKFRRHGYGKEIIKDIIFRFNSSFGVAIIKAFPLQLEVEIGRDEWREKMRYSEMEHNPINATKSLYGFYRSLGFKQIGKGNYFFLNPTHRNSCFDNR